ncbi:putative 4-coumarate--CoA ligase 1 [Grifola frondosa]|uniref:Putative 4-coumarate--CoA ligase 1 n=1 Tax=Grifola frondosa TaxID=5627 RepID=A0A1C7MPU4_GRIFR|nr:putative 4-coumarate--CoA ligase 1 [Grifola frondosa]
MSLCFSYSPGQGKTTIAFLCFSSGTTGRPKAVAVSHYNVISNIVQSATFNRVKDDYAPGPIEDSVLETSVLECYHCIVNIYGLVVNLHVILYFAMTTVISKKFNYERFLQSIAQFRISHLLIVPPQAVLFCKHPLTKRYDLSSVRFCLIAAAPLSIELTNQLLEVLPDISLGKATA